EDEPPGGRVLVEAAVDVVLAERAVGDVELDVGLRRAVHVAGEGVVDLEVVAVALRARLAWDRVEAVDALHRASGSNSRNSSFWARKVTVGLTEKSLRPSARRRFGSRASSRSKAICASSRLSGAPMQKW